MIFCEPNNEDCVTGECVTGLSVYSYIPNCLQTKRNVVVRNAYVFLGNFNIVLVNKFLSPYFHWSFMLFFEFHAISYHSIDLKRLERKKKKTVAQRRCQNMRNEIRIEFDRAQCEHVHSMYFMLICLHFRHNQMNNRIPFGC